MALRIQYQIIAKAPDQPDPKVFESFRHQPLSDPQPNFAAKIKAIAGVALVASGCVWPGPPIVQTADRWWQPLSEPIVKVKQGLGTANQQAFTTGFAGQLEPGPGYESTWHQPWSEPVRFNPAAISRAYNQQTLAHVPFNEDFRIVTKWWQDLSVPPKAKPRTVEYPALAFVAQVEVVTVDKWFAPLSERVRQPFFQGSLQEGITEPFPTEIVTVDKWFQDLSKPRVLTALRTAEYPAFVYGALPIVNTADQWWNDLSVPPRSASRWPASYQDPQAFVSVVAASTVAAFSFDTNGPVFAQSIDYQDIAFTSPSETVTLDKWYQPLQDVPRIKFFQGSLQEGITELGQPIVQTADRWWRDLETPPKVKPRAAQYQDLAYGALPIVQTVDRWWVDLSTPPKGKLRTAQYQDLAFTSPSETITVDKWFVPLSERIVKSPARATEYPALAYLQLPIVQTTDRWWQPLSEPVRRPFFQGSLQEGITELGQPIVQTADRWWRPLSEPTRAKPITPEQVYWLPFTPPSATVTLFAAPAFDTNGPVFGRPLIYQDGAYAPFVETVTVDKWYQDLFKPLVLGKPRATEYPYLAFVGPSETITVDKWFVPLSERIRTLARAVEYPALIYGPIPIVQTVDRWWNDLSVPPKVKPRTVEYPAFAYGRPPLVPGPDAWWRDLDTPPKVKPRSQDLLTTYGYGTPPLIIGPDRWWRDLDTPPKGLVRLPVYQQQPLAVLLTPPTVFPGSWFVPFIQPDRPIGIKYWEQQHFGFVQAQFQGIIRYAYGYIIC